MATTRSTQSEFALIRDYLTGLGAPRPDVLLDIGDDCALTRIPPGFELAFSIDTMVSGRHFFADCDPQNLGHKALAVGLSDLAAIGATPTWATLALTLPESNANWLAAFAAGLHCLASEHGLRLVGGDLTRGPLTISIQAMGLVPDGRAIQRAGARPGDALLVTGQLGDAGLALRLLLRATHNQKRTIPKRLRQRLERPTPRVALGAKLAGLATAAIDVSDGLIADLGHLLARSGCGALLKLQALPLGPEVSLAVHDHNDWALPLASGDDYELCFTVAPHDLETTFAIAHDTDTPVTLIGEITTGSEIIVETPNGHHLNVAELLPNGGGFDHFSQHPPDAIS